MFSRLKKRIQIHNGLKKSNGTFHIFDVDDKIRFWASKGYGQLYMVGFKSARHPQKMVVLNFQGKRAGNVDFMGDAECVKFPVNWVRNIIRDKLGKDYGYEYKHDHWVYWKQGS